MNRIVKQDINSLCTRTYYEVGFFSEIMRQEKSLFRVMDIEYHLKRTLQSSVPKEGWQPHMLWKAAVIVYRIRPVPPETKPLEMY